MVSTRKKRQSNRRLLSQLDDFDQDVIIGNTASERQENVMANVGSNDRDFTVGISGINVAVNEITVNMKTLERCFNERIDREMSNNIDSVEDKIQNAFLTAIDSIGVPKIELAIRSINVSSGRDTTSVTANSERGEHVGIGTPIWKRIWKQQYSTYIKCKCWDSTWHSGRGKWVVGPPRNTFGPAKTHSSHLLHHGNHRSFWQVSLNHKNKWPDKESNLDPYCSREFCFQCTAETFFRRKTVGEETLITKKKEKRPFWRKFLITYR